MHDLYLSQTSIAYSDLVQYCILYHRLNDLKNNIESDTSMLLLHVHCADVHNPKQLNNIISIFCYETA